MARPVFRAVDVSKYFGTIRALERISFEIYPGEIVGLLGDNGAGKSTFIKVISGVFPPTGGELYLNDVRVEFPSPMVARNSGIETAYQDLMLVPQLDMASNFFLGRELLRKGFLGKLGFLDHQRMRDETAKHLRDLKVTVKSINQKVGELSGGQRQAVAIARVGSWGNKLIILDEPTAALGVEESAHVLELMRNLKNRGIPVIFITHTLPFAFEVCDRIVILRLGKDVANLDKKATDVDEVVRIITGSSLSA